MHLGIGVDLFLCFFYGKAIFSDGFIVWDSLLHAFTYIVYVLDKILQSQILLRVYNFSA